MLSAELSSTQSTLLDDDERWKLTRRIVASRGFQRAGQLRSILLYLVTECIVHPERVVREHELAHEVLGRRGDFDPLTDNIVRAQMSHLRRKLDTFYAEEGSAETLRLVLPKGSYRPVFTDVREEQSQPGVVSAVAAETALPEARIDAPPPQPTRRWLTGVLAGTCAVLAALCLFLLLRGKASVQKGTAGAVTKNAAEPNEFVKFLVRRAGPVAIVVPDTSLMMMQNVLGTDITVAEYLPTNFLSVQIARQPDPGVRALLTELHDKRNTSIGESAAAADIVSTLSNNGIESSVRYARDLRTRDLGEGNVVVIGSQRSNPWVKLFLDQLTFRFHQNEDGLSYSFWNVHPQPGERERYVPYVLESGKYSSYIDVAICPNLTHSGYAMLVIGSDMQGNEAAVRYLLHGTLPASVTSAFTSSDQGVFEVFLSSRHAQGEAEENFEVVAVRSGAHS